MRATLNVLEPYKEKATVLRNMSTDAASLFGDGSVDAIFIDAIHHYNAVMQDMQMWWSKVKPGGLMLGHDYYLHGGHGVIFTVKPAALEFGRQMKVPVFHTSDDCWYMVKP